MSFSAISLSSRVSMIFPKALAAELRASFMVSPVASTPSVTIARSGADEAVPWPATSDSFRFYCRSFSIHGSLCATFRGGRGD